MAESRYDVAVIGAGPGGYAAAFEAADLGLRTVLIDEDARLGGTCLLRGCIPSKALLHAARLLTDAEDAQAWGLEFGKPKIDLDALRRKLDTIVGKLTKGVQTLAGSRKVELIRARATFKDATTLTLTGSDGSRQSLSFGHAIVASGSRPAIPAALTLEDPRVMDSTGALALPDVPPRLLVVGGGYIGLELGTVYQALGSEVTVAEALPRLLNGADPDLVKPLQQRLQRRFKAIRLNTKVDKLEEKKEGIAATLAAPDGSTTEVFDRVLVAVGRKPNTEQLGLDHTKAALSPQGFIQVDGQRRTAEPTIFAIGDAVGEPMLAHKASHEGLVAARVIAGKQTAFDATIPAVIFTDPEIAWCGLTEEAANASGRAVTITRFPWAASGRATTLGRNDGVTKLVLDAESGRVLGVGICGVGAGELIAEGVLAIEMGAVAEDVAASIHPHPTLSETVMEAGEMFHGQATHLYSSKTTKR
jgi:dihydrolipoamide dehydrogenase